MKHLEFMGNRVEDAAMAFIDVLKYSDQSVDYPDFKDIEPWPEDIVRYFRAALRDYSFSEQTAILMYTQQSVDYESIAELMLGISLVEMQHLDKIKDFLYKADSTRDHVIHIGSIDIDYGGDPKQALKLALESENETLDHYNGIQRILTQNYSDRVDYDDVMLFLSKLIVDEEHHKKLLEEALGIGIGKKETSKGVTVVIK